MYMNIIVRRSGLISSGKVKNGSKEDKMYVVKMIELVSIVPISPLVMQRKKKCLFFVS
jgi:hypothetical protein